MQMVKLWLLSQGGIEPGLVPTATLARTPGVHWPNLLEAAIIPPVHAPQTRASHLTAKEDTMHMIRKLKFVAAAALALLVMADDAFATKKDEAMGMCRSRGAQCNSYGIGGQNDPGSDVVICVDNRSTGNGVQCVRCTGSRNCTVMYQHPDGRPIRPGKNVQSILANSPAKQAQTPGTTGAGSKVLGSGTNLLGGGSGMPSQGPSATGSPGAAPAAPAAPGGRLY
jgi:hypothetical protein